MNLRPEELHRIQNININIPDRPINEFYNSSQFQQDLKYMKNDLIEIATSDTNLQRNIEIQKQRLLRKLNNKQNIQISYQEKYVQRIQYLEGVITVYQQNQSKFIKEIDLLKSRSRQCGNCRVLQKQLRQSGERYKIQIQRIFKQKQKIQKIISTSTTKIRELEIFIREKDTIIHRIQSQLIQYQRNWQITEKRYRDTIIVLENKLSTTQSSKNWEVVQRQYRERISILEKQLSNKQMQIKNIMQNKIKDQQINRLNIVIQDKNAIIEKLTKQSSNFEASIIQLQEQISRRQTWISSHNCSQNQGNQQYIKQLLYENQQLKQRMQQMQAYYQEQYSQLQQQYNQPQEQYNQLQEQYDQLLEQYNQLQEQYNQLQEQLKNSPLTQDQQIKKKNKQLKTYYQNQYRQLEEKYKIQLQEYKGQISTLQQRQQSYYSQFQSFRSVIEQKDQQIQRLNEILKNHICSKGNDYDVISKQQIRVQQLMKQVQFYRNKYSVSEQLLENLKIEVKQFSKKCSELQTTCKIYEEKIEQLTKQNPDINTRYEEEIYNLNLQIDQQKERYQQLFEINRVNEEKMYHFNGQITSLQERNQYLVEINRKYQEKKNSNEQKNKSNERQQHLLSINRKYEGEIYHLNEQINKLKISIQTHRCLNDPNAIEEQYSLKMQEYDRLYVRYSQTQSQLKQKDTQISTLQQKLSQLSYLQTQITNYKQQIVNYKQQISFFKQQSQSLQQQLHRISILQNELNLKRRELDQQKRIVGERNNIINMLQNELNLKRKEIDQQSKKPSLQGDYRIKILQNDLNIKNRQLDQQRRIAVKRDDRIKILENDLNLKSKQLDQQRRIAGQRDYRISILENELNLKNRELDQQKKKIGQMNYKINILQGNYNIELENKFTQVQYEYQTKITQLNRDINNYRQIEINLATQITRLESIIVGLRQAIQYQQNNSNQNIQVNELNMMLSNIRQQTSQQIAGLKSQIFNLQQIHKKQVTMLNAEIVSMSTRVSEFHFKYDKQQLQFQTISRKLFEAEQYISHLNQQNNNEQYINDLLVEIQRLSPLQQVVNNLQIELNNIKFNLEAEWKAKSSDYERRITSLSTQIERYQIIQSRVAQYQEKYMSATRQIQQYKINETKFMKEIDRLKIIEKKYNQQITKAKPNVNEQSERLLSALQKQIERLQPFENKHQQKQSKLNYIQYQQMPKLEAKILENQNLIKALELQIKRLNPFQNKVRQAQNKIIKLQEGLRNYEGKKSTVKIVQKVVEKVVYKDNQNYQLLKKRYTELEQQVSIWQNNDRQAHDKILSYQQQITTLQIEITKTRQQLIVIEKIISSVLTAYNSNKLISANFTSGVPEYVQDLINTFITLHTKINEMRIYIDNLSENCAQLERFNHQLMQENKSLREKEIQPSYINENYEQLQFKILELNGINENYLRINNTLTAKLEASEMQRQYLFNQYIHMRQQLTKISDTTSFQIIQKSRYIDVDLLRNRINAIQNITVQSILRMKAYYEQVQHDINIQLNDMRKVVDYIDQQQRQSQQSHVMKTTTNVNIIQKSYLMKSKIDFIKLQIQCNRLKQSYRIFQDNIVDNIRLTSKGIADCVININQKLMQMQQRHQAQSSIRKLINNNEQYLNQQYERQIQQLNNKLRQAQHYIQNLENQKINISDSIQLLKRQLQLMRTQIDNINRLYNNAKTEYESLRLQSAQLKQKLLNGQYEIEVAKNQKDEFYNKLKVAEDYIFNFENQKVKLEKELQYAKKQDIEEVYNKLKLAEEYIFSFEQQKIDLQNKLQQHITKKLQIDRELEQIQNQNAKIKQLQNQVDSLTNNKQKIQSRKQQLESIIKSTNNSLQFIQKQNQQLRISNKQTIEKLKGLQQKSELTEQQLKSNGHLLDEINNAQNKINQLQVQLQQSNNDKLNLQARNKQLISATQQLRLNEQKLHLELNSTQALKNKLLQTEKYIVQIQSQKTDLLATLDLFNFQKNRLLNAETILLNQKSVLEHNLSQLYESENILSDQKNELLTKIAQMKGLQNSLINQVNALNERIKQLEQQINSIIDKLQQAEFYIQQIQQQKNGLNNQNNQLGSELSELQHFNIQLVAQNKTLQGQLSELHHKNNESLLIITQLKQNSDKTTQQLNSMEEIVFKLGEAERYIGKIQQERRELFMKDKILEEQVERIKGEMNLIIGQKEKLINEIQQLNNRYQKHLQEMSLEISIGRQNYQLLDKQKRQIIEEIQHIDNKFKQQVDNNIRLQEQNYSINQQLQRTTSQLQNANQYSNQQIQTLRMKLIQVQDAFQIQSVSVEQSSNLNFQKMKQMEAIIQQSQTKCKEYQAQKDLLVLQLQQKKTQLEGMANLLSEQSMERNQILQENQQLRNIINNLEVNIKQAEKEAIQIKKDYQNLINEKKITEDTLTESRTHTQKEMNERIDELLRDIKTVNDQKQNLYQNYMQITSERDQLIQQINKLANDLNHLQQNQNLLNIAQEDLTNEINHLAAKLNQQTQVKSNLLKQFTEIANANNELSQQNQQLNILIAQQQNENNFKESEGKEQLKYAKERIKQYQLRLSESQLIQSRYEQLVKQLENSEKSNNKYLQAINALEQQVKTYKVQVQEVLNNRFSNEPVAQQMMGFLQQCLIQINTLQNNVIYLQKQFKNSNKSLKKVLANKNRENEQNMIEATNQLKALQQKLLLNAEELEEEPQISVMQNIKDIIGSEDTFIREKSKIVSYLDMLEKQIIKSKSPQRAELQEYSFDENNDIHIELQQLQKQVNTYHEEATRLRHRCLEKIEQAIHNVDEMKDRYTKVEQQVIEVRQYEPLLGLKLQQTLFMLTDFMKELIEQQMEATQKQRPMIPSNYVDILEVVQRKQKQPTDEQFHNALVNLKNSIDNQISLQSASDQQFFFRSQMGNIKSILDSILKSKQISQQQLKNLQQRVLAIINKDKQENLQLIKEHLPKLHTILQTQKTDKLNADKIDLIVKVLTEKFSPNQLRNILNNPSKNLIARKIEQALEFAEQEQQEDQSKIKPYLQQNIKYIKDNIFKKPTKLSEEINKVIVKIVSSSNDDELYMLIEELFKIIYDTEQHFENIIRNKDYEYKQHTAQMHRVLNRSQSEQSEDQRLN